MTNKCDWMKAKPIAHRGLHDKTNGVIENSQTAFLRAIDAGMPIETDLQLSGDGKAMVFHDETLGRLTHLKDAVNAMSADELSKVQFKQTDDKIMTLIQFLELVDGKVPLIIELKTSHNGSVELAKRAVEVISSYTGKIGLMSFDPRLVAAVRVFGPDICCGATVMSTTEQHWLAPVPDSEDLPVGFASPGIDLSRPVVDLINPDFISSDIKSFPSEFADRFKAAGKPVISWTIKDQETADYAYGHSDQITYEDFTPN